MPKDICTSVSSWATPAAITTGPESADLGWGQRLLPSINAKRSSCIHGRKAVSGSYTHIDLDLITRQPPLMEVIPEPIPKDIPAGTADLVNADHGTLVIWTKYDRQHEGALDLIDELRVWVGRTYRHFIWGSAKIWINAEPVKAIDPLYVTTRLTRFPDDPPAHEYKTIEFSGRWHQRSRVKGAPPSLGSHSAQSSAEGVQAGHRCREFEGNEGPFYRPQ